MYQFLNIFFFFFHTAFTIFNLTGWIFKRTRKVHLVTILLTATSWFVLGIWYGWGYCICTDWHWQVRAHLGYHDMPQSYITFLIGKLTGLQLHESLVENSTAAVFICCAGLSIWLNIRDWKRKNHFPSPLP